MQLARGKETKAACLSDACPPSSVALPARRKRQYASLVRCRRETLRRRSASGSLVAR